MDSSSVSARSAQDSRGGEVDAQIRIEIREIGIPPRPKILRDIDEEMATDEPDFVRLAEIIASDVALAAGLIKTTNSPYFGFGKKVRSVSEAILVLGLQTVTRTLAGLALQKIFPYVPSLERFWDASANTARTAAWVAQQLGGGTGVRPADAYTFGLFRDCGIPVLLIPFPEYSRVLQAANEEPVKSFTEIERARMEIDHATVGASLAENWLLPEDMCIAIRHHHDRAMLIGEKAESLPLGSRHMIALAQLAERLVQRETGLSRSCEWEKLGAACTEVLALDEGSIAELEAVYHQRGPLLAAC